MSTVVELSPPVHTATGDTPREDRAVRVLPAAKLSALDSTLFDDIGGLIDSVLERCILAEEEIEAAQRRHGEGDRGPLWNSFRLLRTTHERPWPNLVYRAHCRELLERVAAGIDTRPATDAEKISVLSTASQTAPLNSGAETLYLRIGTRLFPHIFEGIGDVLDIKAYEKEDPRQPCRRLRSTARAQTGPALAQDRGHRRGDRPSADHVTSVAHKPTGTTAAAHRTAAVGAVMRFPCGGRLTQASGGWFSWRESP